MNDALLELVEKRLVEPKEAYMKAVDKTSFVAGLKAKGHDTSFVDADPTNAPAAPKPGSRR